MIKTFWNEEDYNTITDGAVKNINGSGMFVPYMYGVEDPIYKKYIEELLKFTYLFNFVVCSRLFLNSYLALLLYVFNLTIWSSM